MTGQVTRIDRTRGIAFVKDASGRRTVFYRSSMLHGRLDFDELEEGTLVRCGVEQTARGARACCVERIDAGERVV